jgi:hypothetical protein
LYAQKSNHKLFTFEKVDSSMKKTKQQINVLIFAVVEDSKEM